MELARRGALPLGCDTIIAQAIPPKIESCQRLLATQRVRDRAAALRSDRVPLEREFREVRASLDEHAVRGAVVRVQHAPE